MPYTKRRDMRLTCCINSGDNGFVNHLRHIGLGNFVD